MCAGARSGRRVKQPHKAAPCGFRRRGSDASRPGKLRRAPPRHPTSTALPLPFLVVETGRGGRVEHPILITGVCTLCRVRPSRARARRRRYDDGAIASADLDLVGKASLGDQWLRQPNALGVSDSHDSSLHRVHLLSRDYKEITERAANQFFATRVGRILTFI